MDEAVCVSMCGFDGHGIEGCLLQSGRLGDIADFKLALCHEPLFTDFSWHMYHCNACSIDSPANFDPEAAV